MNLIASSSLFKSFSPIACLVAQCPTICHSMKSILQDPLFMEFFRQEYWSRLLLPIPGNLPDPGIKLMSPVSHVLQVDSLPTEPLDRQIQTFTMSFS